MLLCPMPGLVVSVNVTEGQDVKAGEALAVVDYAVSEAPEEREERRRLPVL